MRRPRAATPQQIERRQLARIKQVERAELEALRANTKRLAAAAKEAAQRHMREAYFDDFGVCFLLASGPEFPPLERFAYVGKVPAGTDPNLIWYNEAKQRVQKSRRVNANKALGVPDWVMVGTPVRFDVPKDCALDIGGKLVDGTVELDASAVGHFPHLLKGRLVGTLRLEVRTHVEARRADYPSVGDQLDAIWKSLPEGAGEEAQRMRKEIMAVKAAYPKPDPEA